MSLLYEHQRAGAEHLAKRRRHILGDPPGLGKTRTLIAALDLVGARRPLVVAPAVGRSHWHDEFLTMNVAGMQPHVLSYEQVVRGHARPAAEYDSLVLDEVHRVKTAGSLRTKYLIHPRTGLAREMPHVYGASGTFPPKHAGELWTIVSSLFPEEALALGIKRYEEWIEEFCYWYRIGPYYNSSIKFRPGVKNAETLRGLLSNIVLRRTEDEVGVDVPMIDWQVIPLDSDAALQADIPPALRAEIERRIEAEESLEDLFDEEHIARLRRRVGLLKANATASLLYDELADSDEKVVIMAHHREVLKQLCIRLGRTFEIAYIDGDTPDRQRGANIQRFQNDASCRVFIGQQTACMESITLTAARRVVLVEPDWTASNNFQAAKRVARIGQQSKRCIAQMVALAGTLDDAVVRHHAAEVRALVEMGALV